MTQCSPLEREVARLIVEAVNLEDIEPDDITPDSSLFGDGLGLDSIDALEIALAVSQQYGVQLRSDHPDIRQIFGSLRALACYIEDSRVSLPDSPAASA
ncbi:MAG: acyl carrier protein [Pseudomonadota bacterium]|nr:MAG: acyl carrier protein [Pseudomonadota bacterium]